MTSYSVQCTTGSHNASACFLLGVRLSPRSTLRQTTYATTRKLARVCGRGISPLAYRHTPQRELHPSYRTIREMFNCLLTTTRFYAFAPRLSSFRSLSGISMLGFYIAFSNRPFGLVTRGFSVSRLVTTLSLLPTPNHLKLTLLTLSVSSEDLELSVRFELTTFRLQGECSAIEL